MIEEEGRGFCLDPDDMQEQEQDKDASEPPLSPDDAGMDAGGDASLDAGLDASFDAGPDDDAG
jgi:hypothetical protein